jgi:serine protease Do
MMRQPDALLQSAPTGCATFPNINHANRNPTFDPNIFHSGVFVILLWSGRVMSNTVPPISPPRQRFPANRAVRYALISGVCLAAVVGAPLALQQVPGLADWAPYGAPELMPRAYAVEAAPAPIGAPSPNEARPAGFADIVAKVKPAVISVRVKLTQGAVTSGDQSNNVLPFLPGSPLYRFFRQFGNPGVPSSPEITGEGSGFLISPDGYAVTNNHVVDHADQVTVTTDDSTVYTAKVIGTDPSTDLALIKVNSDKTFPYVKFADGKPRIGDWVVAVGNPFGLGGTVTAGIVSAEGRDIGGSPYDDFIQIDAPINKGNSGGPAFDVNGNVIGVNTAIFSPTGGSIGIGFDIPAATAKAVVAQLKEQGLVVRGWIGVQVQPVTADIADSLGMKKAEGALVAEPQPNSPAAKAGIEAGDVITNVNGKAVIDSRELAQKIAAMAPGTTVKLELLSNGAARTLYVTLGELPKQQEANTGAEQSSPQSNLAPQLGLSVAPADRVAGAGQTGVVVTAVDPNGAAAERGLHAGDVILDVGGKSVANAADVRAALSNARERGKHDVLMRVKTADVTKFVALPIGQG